MCEICSNLTIDTPKHNYSGVSVAGFEQVNAIWEWSFYKIFRGPCKIIWIKIGPTNLVLGMKYGNLEESEASS